jgi:hypothetical protein
MKHLEWALAKDEPHVASVIRRLIDIKILEDTANNVFNETLNRKHKRRHDVRLSLFNINSYAFI